VASNIDDWKSQLEDVRKKEEKCKNYRDIIEGEKKFQAQNAKLLRWISAVDPSYEHENVLASTKVDSDYSDCGQWFIDSDAFLKWRAAGHSKTLWLRGTGNLTPFRHSFLQATRTNLQFSEDNC
jgi:hypothetical protein